MTILGWFAVDGKQGSKPTVCINGQITFEGGAMLGYILTVLFIFLLFQKPERYIFDYTTEADRDKDRGKMPQKARRWVAVFFVFVFFACGLLFVLVSYGYSDFAGVWMPSMIPVMSYLIWRIYKSEKEAASELDCTTEADRDRDRGKMPKKARRWVAVFFVFCFFACGLLFVLVSYGYSEFVGVWMLSMISVMSYLIWRIHKSEKEAKF